MLISVANDSSPLHHLRKYEHYSYAAKMGTGNSRHASA